MFGIEIDQLFFFLSSYKYSQDKDQLARVDIYALWEVNTRDFDRTCLTIIKF